MSLYKKLKFIEMKLSKRMMSSLKSINRILDVMLQRDNICSNFLCHMHMGLLAIERIHFNVPLLDDFPRQFL